MQTYTTHPVPDESTLRKSYLKYCYESKTSAIRAELQNQRICLSIDETTDSLRRQIVNVIVGVLRCDKSRKSYLLHFDSMENTNHETITKCFLSDDAVKIIDRENVLLFVTDY